MRKAGKTIVKDDYGAITQNWKHKPKFDVLISLTGPGPVILVGTDDEIYRYVDEGTRPHTIRPKRAKVLAFNAGHTAKTMPGVIGSRPGGPFGETVFAHEVKHPGTKARNFEKAIKKKRTPWFKREMEKALKIANRKAGYAL